MPVLADPRHEKFAQAVARGMDQTSAYTAAGFKESRSAASRLSAKVNVTARIRELTEKQAAIAIESSAFEAKMMFDAVLKDIEDAKEAGQHKVAADLRMFFIRCFGYEDSPTLTHEHVKGQKLQQDSATEGDGAANGHRPAQSSTNNVTPILKALRDIKRKTG